MQGDSFQRNIQNNSVGREDIFNKHFSLIMSSNFRYQRFVEVSGNTGEKVPIVNIVLSCHEQEIYPTTSPNENCIEFKFQTGHNYYVDLKQPYLVLNLKFVKGRVYETYNSEEEKKEHKEEAKAEEETVWQRRSNRLQFISLLM